MNKSIIGRELAALRKTKEVTCPKEQGGCGETRTTLERAKAICPKCRDKLRKRLIALGKDSIK